MLIRSLERKCPLWQNTFELRETSWLNAVTIVVKKRKIAKGISDIEKVEVDLEDYSDEEEKFMPLCSECVKNGKWGTERY